MADLLQFLLILFPFGLAIYLLVIKRWKADTTGIIVWLLVSILAYFLSTSLSDIFIISIAGIVDSLKITLMVGASIFMITYMSESGALKRIIVFIKTLKGSHPAWQILYLNFGFGCFLVSIGATPVSILPPIMIALGFPPVAAVALPAIGYDPLTTYALLGIPAVVFTGEMAQLSDLGILLQAAPSLQEVGMTFSLYMPVISTGIAISMLFIAGGMKMLKDPNSLLIAILTGATAGITAIISNYFGVVTLTGIISGIAVLIVLGFFALSQGYPLLDRSSLTKEDKEIEQQMSLKRALSPWMLLILFALLTNLIQPVFNLLFYELPFLVNIGDFTLKTRFLWQAYTWVIVAIILSFFFLPSDRQTIKQTSSLFWKRGKRPMISSAIFFAVAWILNYSAPNNESLNMVFILSEFTSTNFGLIFPFLVPFIGFFGGFVSGSETSSIKMFSRYHVQTSNALNLDPLTMATSNGIGGGLASVITPAKVQNAAATIDEIGIEGQVIKKTILIALIMVSTLAILTVFWAHSFPVIDTTLILALLLTYVFISVLVFCIAYLLRLKTSPSPKSGLDQQ
ncbi:MAG: L-lactate permease [Candidatus Heimdallarchaeota archaeon]|nr:L-lactate permease [Candidatus Heimdallarchaeota archaeon]